MNLLSPVGSKVWHSLIRLVPYVPYVLDQIRFWGILEVKSTP